MRQIVRGGRPPTEYISGQQRRNPRTPSHSEPEDRGPMPHVDLRVIRKADLRTSSPERDEWRDFLDEFASENHALGTGRSLGAVAMTYVPAKYMNTMLEAAWPADYKNRKRKIGMFRRVNANLRAFMEEAGMKVGSQKLAEVQLLHDERVSEWRADHVEDLFDEGGRPVQLPPPLEVTELSPTEKQRLETYRFGPATLSVRGLSLFYGNRYGADLSGEELAIYERQDIIDHLRREEGLDVSMLDASWKPHAAIFDVHPYLQVPDNLPLREYAPRNLVFLPPTTEAYGLDGTVLSR